jgi:hypothetical protein
MSITDPDFTRAEASALLDFRQAVWLVFAVHHGRPGYQEAAADVLALLDTPAI